MSPRAGTRVRDFVVIDDHQLLRTLCGPGHRNLAVLEGAWGGEDLRADSPGGGVALEGAPEAVREARAALEFLAARISAGAEGTSEEVRGAVFHARSMDAARDPTAPARENGARDNGGNNRKTAGIVARSEVQHAYLAALRDPRPELIFGIGPAGTGKTFLAVAQAVAELQADRVRRLVITRPAVEAGERLGFLPGDLAEKVDPYLRPIWDALGELLGPGPYEKHRAAGRIEVAPFAFMRGRTLKDAFIIVDEAQNATRMQMKMALTRLGSGSRIVVTGDPSQIDLPRPAESGLTHAVGLLEHVEGVRVIRFSSRDVVRHPLVERVVSAYDSEEKALRKARSTLKAGTPADPGDDTDDLS